MGHDYWQIGIVALIAFYVAWNLGANDVANSMGTSVGSKALTLGKAIAIAGILEFSGAVIFGRNVSETLATDIVNPALFKDQPSILLLGMLSVSLSCGIWLQLATNQGWPVASSHAVVGAIAGFSWVAAGIQAVSWSTLGSISLTWVLTPFMSGTVAGLFYSQLKRWILDQAEPLEQLREWIPWLSCGLVSIFGAIVLPTVVKTSFFTALQTQLGWAIPAKTLSLGIGAIAAIGLTFNGWQTLENWQSKIQTSTRSPSQNSPDPKTFKDKKFPSPVEQQLARFQVLSACFVAFAHGSNDVGNAVAPLAAIAYIRRTGNVPGADFSVPFWILLLGGAGIVFGLSIWGYKVIATIGEKIIALEPSSGFCAELATAGTVLLASRLGLPVSTSHALVGAVVGIGLTQKFLTQNDHKDLQLETIRDIGLAWLITLPIAALLAAGIFSVLCQFVS